MRASVEPNRQMDQRQCRAHGGCHRPDNRDPAHSVVRFESPHSDGSGNDVSSRTGIVNRRAARSATCKLQLCVRFITLSVFSRSLTILRLPCIGKSLVFHIRPSKESPRSAPSISKIISRLIGQHLRLLQPGFEIVNRQKKNRQQNERQIIGARSFVHRLVT